MRPIFVRVLTGALAITGIAGAIALPTLTVGVEATSPPYVFAVPASPADVVIMADPRSRAGDARGETRNSCACSTCPRTTGGPASPAVFDASAHRARAPRQHLAPAAAVPKPLPSPSRSRARLPCPLRLLLRPLPPRRLRLHLTPSSRPRRPTPEPPVVRAVIVVAPVAEEPEDETCKRKKHKTRTSATVGRTMRAATDATRTTTVATTTA